MNVNKWQFVWDPTTINKAETDAQFRVGEFQKKECVFRADDAWENNQINYSSIFKDGDIYRMYYLAHISKELVDDEASKKCFEGNMKATIMPWNIFICYAESKDGLHWVKPNLGICSYNGNKENNIILRSQDMPGPDSNFFDNFFAFKDTNPNCPPDERYKALAYYDTYRLSTYYSADGIHFRFGNLLDMDGKFDTHNVCYWDERIGKYVAYIRDFHDIPPDGDINRGIRDARRTESEDFVHWTKPELIKFVDSEDYPIYTNHVMRYYRNEDVYIGFPTRYMERLEWTENYEALGGREYRLEQMKLHPRLGLTVTDCIFMTSRDGLHWHKYDEAIIPPLPEYEYNWRYGDCYPSYAMFETTSDDGVNKELSMFLPISEGRFEKGSMYRMTIRIDGFGYYFADYAGKTVTTEYFDYDGGDLCINFSTSARGNIYITAETEEGEKVESYEVFGNSTERRVRLAGLEKLVGKKVRLVFRMKDARLYSFVFKK